MSSLTFHLYNLDTNQTTELTPDTLRPIAPSELLVLPHESIHHLQNIQTNWLTQFPGASPLLQKLRAHLIAADWSLIRAQAASQQAQLELHLQCLPMHSWNQSAYHRHHLMHELQLQAERDFTRSLDALQAAAYLAQQKYVKENPPPTSAPKRLDIDFRQAIKVEVIDGQIVTDNNLPASDVLRGRPWPEGCNFWRDFYFPNAVIPEPYAWVLTDNGITHKPSRFVSILYEQDEFIRLCYLEIENASEFVLDGERLQVTRKDLEIENALYNQKPDTPS